jgi:hypothetical protein
MPGCFSYVVVKDSADENAMSGVGSRACKLTRVPDALDDLLIAVQCISEEMI